MVKIWASISAFFTVFVVSAQLSVYEAPNIGNVALEVQEQAHRITAKVDSDKEKVTSIYFWIIQNISYDGIVMKKPDTYRSSADVLGSGRAVCFGYAQLFRDMCASIGVISYVVTGYGFERGIPYRLPDEANHAWNTVMVDDQWELVDATWGSGVNSGKYLFTSPTEFGESHVPCFYGWRLTPCTDSRFFNPIICDLSDSLELFLNYGLLHRAITEARADYIMNSSARNHSILGQAHINLAIDLKEKADMEKDSSAIAAYGQALTAFERGASYQEALFDWQKEAWAFAILNRANIIYNILNSTSYTIDSVAFIISEYKTAIAILETVKASFTAVFALEQSRLQLTNFESELKKYKN